MRVQERPQDALVLLGLDRARRVDEPPPRAHERRHALEERALPRGVASEVFGREAPAAIPGVGGPPRSAISSALPPGAAQASRTRPSPAARRATSCEAASC